MLSTWRMWWECQWRAENGDWHYAISTLCNRITRMHRFLTEDNSSNSCWRTRSYKHGVFKICIFATRPDFLQQRWLLGSRMPVTLRHLTYEVPTTTLYVNMLERCGRMWHLESFRLRYTDIRLTTAHTTAPRFRFLLSLSLSDMVSVTALQL
jgi:hypothetical protein